MPTRLLHPASTKQANTRLSLSFIMVESISREELHATLDAFLESRQNLAIDKAYLRELIQSDQERLEKPLMPSIAERDRRLADIRIIRRRFLDAASEQDKQDPAHGFFIFHLSTLFNMDEAELRVLRDASIEDINAFLDDCWPFTKHRKIIPLRFLPVPFYSTVPFHPLSSLLYSLII